MLQSFCGPSFLPSCIMAGVSFMFLVLVLTLPANHAFALVVGTAVAVGLVTARLHREALEKQPMERRSARI